MLDWTMFWTFTVLMLTTFVRRLPLLAGKKRKKTKKRTTGVKTLMSSAWVLLLMNVHVWPPLIIRPIKVPPQVEAPPQGNGKLFRVRTLVTKRMKIRIQPLFVWLCCWLWLWVASKKWNEGLWLRARDFDTNCCEHCWRFESYFDSCEKCEVGSVFKIS